jgi:hypothetical protein
MMMLRRRALILAIAGLIASVAARAQGPRIGLDEFIAVSERLLQRANLDREIAQLYLTAINADADAAVTLAYVVQSNGNPTPEQKVLSATIVEWWRTGVYEINGEPRLAARSRAIWARYPPAAAAALE